VGARAELTQRATDSSPLLLASQAAQRTLHHVHKAVPLNPIKTNKVAMTQMPYPSNRETHSYSSVIMLQVDMLSRRRLWMHTFSNTPTQTRAADG
jgi:hypothetical protein